jgi:hypothetical protein
VFGALEYSGFQFDSFRLRESTPNLARRHAVFIARSMRTIHVGGRVAAEPQPRL